MQPQLFKQNRALTTEQLEVRNEILQDQRLIAWLSQVESPLRGSYIEHAPTEDGMCSSLASRLPTRERKENVSMAKAIGARTLKLTDSKLRLRRINKNATADRMLLYFGSILKTELPRRPLKDIEGLRTILENFLRQMDEHPNDDCYSYIDDFSYKFDQCKSSFSYPIMNRRYFEADLKRYLAGNEALLQRTIMIHIVNQYWLDKIFDWNYDGQWSQPKDTYLPSREDDRILLPKPELAISFTLDSFTTEEDNLDLLPLDLEKCISPDGGDRCFPFLFIEVRKAEADLEDAYMANLHSASQALYNMYTCMVRAGQEQEFFKTVRVFSVVFNAQHMSVRVHRAERLLIADGSLKFQFDDFSRLARHERDDAYHAYLLIQTILTDYAAPELHLALKATFLEIVEQEDERVLSTRKACAAWSASTKRTH